MNIGFPSPHQHSISSFDTVREPLAGETVVENKGSVLKPVEEASSIASAKNERGAAAQGGAQGADSTKSEAEANAAANSAERQRESRQLEAEEVQIQELSARDREVRNHERAHAAAGGQYAGSPRYDFQRGPDGVNYAVGGEVSISTSPIEGDPLATIQKAQIVRRAALAPAEPSPQDRSVAAQASQMEAQARVELSAQQREQRLEDESTQEKGAVNSQGEQGVDSSDQTAPSTNDSNEQQTESQQVFNRLSTNLNNRIISSGDNALQTFNPGQIVSNFA